MWAYTLLPLHSSIVLLFQKTSIYTSSWVLLSQLRNNMWIFSLVIWSLYTSSFFTIKIWSCISNSSIRSSILESNKFSVLYVQYINPAILLLLYSLSIARPSFGDAFLTSFIRKSVQHICLLLAFLTIFCINFLQYFMILLWLCILFVVGGE